MIKELSEKDTDNIIQLENSFKDYFNKVGIIEDLKNNVFSRYFIYKDGDIIKGFVNYYDLIDRFEISYIEVKEEYRNNHIGSSMLEYLINIGKEKKIINITLEVNENNKNAIKLYTNYGFETVAERKKYYNGTDGYLMERKMI